MKPYYEDTNVTLYNKSSFDMSEIPNNTIQCVVTSPPYWGLRKYDGNQSVVNGYAFGLEPTPEMYVEHTMLILKEIHRILKPDGAVFWNIDDSYMGGKGQSGRKDYNLEKRQQEGRTLQRREYCYQDQDAPQDLCKHDFIKPKDLCLIPFHVAIEAQKQGWWVRSVIIWSKPNPMPESVKDRPTSSHEYILMLTKSNKYYWDIDAVREPVTESTISRYTREWNGNGERDYPNGPQNNMKKFMSNDDAKNDSINNGRNIRDVWTITTQAFKDAHFATYPEEIVERCILAATKINNIVLDPFSGSGTTGKVAKSLNRKAILYELSSKYCDMAIKRVQQVTIPMELNV